MSLDQEPPDSQRSHEVTQRGRARDVEGDQGGAGEDLQGPESQVSPREGAGAVCEQGGGGGHTTGYRPRIHR